MRSRLPRRRVVEGLARLQAIWARGRSGTPAYGSRGAPQEALARYAASAKSSTSLRTERRRPPPWLHAGSLSAALMPDPRGPLGTDRSQRRGGVIEHFVVHDQAVTQRVQMTGS